MSAMWHVVYDFGLGFGAQDGRHRVLIVFLHLKCQIEGSQLPLFKGEWRMDSKAAPCIVEIERLDGGVLVTFEDRKSAFYSAELLYATLPQARAIPEFADEVAEG